MSSSHFGSPASVGSGPRDNIDVFKATRQLAPLSPNATFAIKPSKSLLERSRPASAKGSSLTSPHCRNLFAATTAENGAQAIDFDDNIELAYPNHNRRFPYKSGPMSQNEKETQFRSFYLSPEYVISPSQRHRFIPLSDDAPFDKSKFGTDLEEKYILIDENDQKRAEHCKRLQEEKKYAVPTYKLIDEMRLKQLNDLKTSTSNVAYVDPTQLSFNINDPAYEKFLMRKQQNDSYTSMMQEINRRGTFDIDLQQKLGSTLNISKGTANGITGEATGRQLIATSGVSPNSSPDVSPIRVRPRTAEQHQSRTSGISMARGELNENSITTSGSGGANITGSSCFSLEMNHASGNLSPRALEMKESIRRNLIPTGLRDFFSASKPNYKCSVVLDDEFELNTTSTSSFIDDISSKQNSIHKELDEVSIKEDKVLALNLHDRLIGDDNGSCLAIAINQCHFLKYVDLSGNRLSDSVLSTILSSLFHHRTIQILDISNNINIDIRTMAVIINFLRHPKCSLRQLTISRLRLDDQLCRNLVNEGLGNNRSLSKLCLSRNAIGNSENHKTFNPGIQTGGAAFAELILSDCIKLKELDLSWNSIQKDSATRLATSIANEFLTIESLNLSHNNMGDLAGQKLAHSLRSNRTLTFLDVSYNCLLPYSAIVFGSSLEQNTAIKRLILSGNSFGTIGIKALLRCVRTAANNKRTLLVSLNNCYTEVANSALSPASTAKPPAGGGGEDVSKKNQAKPVKNAPIVAPCPVPLVDEAKEAFDVSRIFDRDEPRGMYTLKLDDPYSYAIACNLIDVIDKNPNAELKKFKLKEPGSESRDISLARVTLPNAASNLQLGAYLENDDSLKAVEKLDKHINEFRQHKGAKSFGNSEFSIDWFIYNAIAASATSNSKSNVNTDNPVASPTTASNYPIARTSASPITASHLRCDAPDNEEGMEYLAKMEKREVLSRKVLQVKQTVVEIANILGLDILAIGENATRVVDNLCNTLILCSYDRRDSLNKILLIILKLLCKMVKASNRVPGYPAEEVQEIQETGCAIFYQNRDIIELFRLLGLKICDDYTADLNFVKIPKEDCSNKVKRGISFSPANINAEFDFLNSIQDLKRKMRKSPNNNTHFNDGGIHYKKFTSDPPSCDSFHLNNLVCNTMPVNIYNEENKPTSPSNISNTSSLVKVVSMEPTSQPSSVPLLSRKKETPKQQVVKLNRLASRNQYKNVSIVQNKMSELEDIVELYSRGVTEDQLISIMLTHFLNHVGDSPPPLQKWDVPSQGTLTANLIFTTYLPPSKREVLSDLVVGQTLAQSISSMSDENEDKLKFIKLLLSAEDFYMSSAVALQLLSVFRNKNITEPYWKSVEAFMCKIYSPFEARVFISRAFDSVEDISLFIKNIGSSTWNAIAGVYNGHYMLDLSVENDRFCLKMLIAKNNLDLITRTQTFESQEVKSCAGKDEQVAKKYVNIAADIAIESHQDSKVIPNFRNILLNGVHFSLTKAFLLNIPNTGILRFDFVTNVRPPYLLANKIDDKILEEMVNNVLKPLHLKRSQSPDNHNVNGSERSNKTNISKILSNFAAKIDTRRESNAGATSSKRGSLRSKVKDTMALVIETTPATAANNAVTLVDLLKRYNESDVYTWSELIDTSWQVYKSCYSLYLYSKIKESKENEVIETKGKKGKGKGPSISSQYSDIVNNPENLTLPLYKDACLVPIFKAGRDKNASLMSSHINDAINSSVSQGARPSSSPSSAKAMSPTGTGTRAANTSATAPSIFFASSAADSLHSTCTSIMTSAAKIGLIGRCLEFDQCLKTLQAQFCFNVWISCDQLISIVRKLIIDFNAPAEVVSAFIISSFHRIVDVENIGRVFMSMEDREFSLKVHSDVAHRLGIFNIWSPLSPDGNFELDLASKEHFEVAKTLIKISSIEGGTDITWQHQAYRTSLIENPIKGWKVPQNWSYSDPGPNRYGFLTLHYRSNPGNSISASSVKDELSSGLAYEWSDDQITAIMEYFKSCLPNDPTSPEGLREITLPQFEAAFCRYRAANYSKEEETYCRGLMERLQSLIFDSDLTLETWFTSSLCRNTFGTRHAGGTGDARVTHLELIDSITRLCAQRSMPAWDRNDIFRVMKYMDPNADTDITLRELEWAFKNFRAPPEFHALLRSTAPVMTKFEAFMQSRHMTVKDLFFRIDTNGSSKISQRELLTMIKKVLGDADKEVASSPLGAVVSLQSMDPAGAFEDEALLYPNPAAVFEKRFQFWISKFYSSSKFKRLIRICNPKTAALNNNFSTSATNAGGVGAKSSAKQTRSTCTDITRTTVKLNWDILSVQSISF